MHGTRALTVIGLVAFLLLVLVPFWWIASMSFKTYEQIQFAVFDHEQSSLHVGEVACTQ